ncbi:hypothetical protein FSP39_010780 [Pinctada imbricata]|uniref:Vitellogenin domain-containing protein n=1 Tax=Pinctada imbricata TaxID=66713 RepID=A0AA88Y5Y7_PINIB|nr:hypothetical protein FSP39_010780 [Pinctada imbricata]
MEPKLLLILALVAGTYAGTNKFGYQPGTTYEFDYDVDTATLLQGASEGLSGMKMSAKVKLEVLSKCDLVLQVEGVSLKERNPSLPESFLLSAANSEFKQALEEHPLRFSFQDGRIDSLCPSEGDKSWVLNIKRGILSMIQNTMDDLSADQKVKETDVAGTCDADYTVEKNGWYSVTIKKNKNLLGCTERHSVNTAIQGTPYNVPSDIQSLPIMKSLHECQQEVSKSGILKSSTCSESHIFRPFSREESGAVTKSKQTLKYVRESSGVSSPRNVKSKTNMVFEHSYDPAKEQKTRRQIMDTLKAICVSTKEGVRQETPRLFAELVSSLKSVDASTIKSLYETVKSGSVCTDNNERVRKFFLDAIPMVGTSSSVHMLVKLITDNEITGTEADMWMTTLSFIQRPTKEMLNELKQIATRNGKSMLAVSSLLNNYCKSTSCELDMDVRDIVSALENKIGYGCYVDDNNVENVVVTLRALGNAGYISNVLPTINSCLTRKENPMEVRIAAAESFRRASCDTDKSDIEGIFKNVEEDSELRIAAYLALMECPSDAVLRTVKITLENEEVNQVGSFVWSHLTNLMETSNPLKQEVRSIIEDETLKKEFDLDKRKFSRNYEWSFFLDKLNTGASVESNMIWSSKSFIPRSLMANLTVDLFGQSINLLEVGGRIEGLEYFLETYFGPNGYFAEKTVKEATKQVVKGIDSRKMNKLDLQFASEMDKLKGTLYMRIFGNDIRYKSFRGSQDLFSGSNINILELLISLSKQHDYTFTQNVMFLDSGIIIPTAAGFPMNLTLNGTATMDFAASGKIDLRKLGTSPRSLIISGLVRPSAAIEITSLMSVDAFVAKSGLKMVSTLHSSTQLKGQVSLKDGQIFNAEWEPSDKTEILSVKSSFYTVHRDEEREQNMITENRKSHQLCTGSKLAIMTGLELCGVMEFPNASMKADAPYFPLTGPVSAEVAMFKRDTHKSYKIQSNLINNRNEFDMKMYFNTPGSKVSRLLSANVLLKKNDKTLEMNLISPWKKGSFKGDVVDTRDLKRVSGVVLLDEKKEFKASAEMARSRKGNSFFYTPSLEIKADKMKPIGLKGSIEYRPSQSFESEITLSGVTKSPVVTKLSLMNKKVIVSMKASLSVEKKKEYVFESRLQTSKTKKAVKYRPFLSIRSPTKEYVAFGGSAEYKQGKALVVDLTLDQITTKPMKFFVRIRNAATKKSSRYQGKVDIRTPIFTTKMQSNFVMRGTKAVIVRSTIDYVVPRVVRDRVRLNGKINMASTKSMKAVKGTMDVMFKKAAFLNGNLAFNVQHNKKHSEAEVDFRYGPNKKDTSKRVYLQTILNHVRISKIKKTQIDVRSKAIVPVMGIDLQVKGAFAQQPNSLETSLAFTAGKKHSYLTSISLKDKSKKLMSYIGEARLSYPGRDIVLTNDFTQSNSKKYLHKFSATFGSQSSLSTESIFRIIDKDEYEISTTVSLPKTKPFTLSGQVKLNKQNFHTAGQLKSGSDVYALSASSKYRYGSLIDLSTDIKYPSRRITAALEARNKRPLYSSRLEVNWDADKGTSQRFQLKGDVTFDNIDNIAAELSKTCPKGKVKFSMKHTGGKQYITHADLEWDEKKQMSLDTSFQVSNGVKSASLKVRSPFKNFRSIAISADHNEKRVETKSMITVDWKPLKQISSVLTMKKPVSLSNIEGNLELKTPFKGFETSSVDIKHQLKDSYKATIKTALNQAYVQMEIGGSSSGILNAMLDLQTNIGPITSLAIAAKHSQTGNKLENSATLKVNGHAYRYSGEMTHYRYGWQLQNNGRLTLSTPTRKFENVWSHRNTGKEMRSTMRSDMDGQIAEYTVNANQNMAFDQGAMSVGITIKSPFDQMKNTDFSLSHEHRHGFMDTTIRINHNKQSRLSFTNNYLRTPEQTTSSIEIVANRKNMALKSSSKYGTYPVTGSTELTVNGRSIGLLDGSLNIDKDSLLNGNLGVQSDSLPSMRMSLSQNKERGELVTRTTLEYGKRQPIVLEKRYQWGRKKSIALVMTTPFASLQRLTMGSEFTGNMDSFHSAANFQLQPTVGPISASAQWSTYGGYLANLRLDTPYDNLSSVKFSAKSEMKGQDRKSDLSIEYLKSKFIKIESSLRPVLKDLNGYIKMKTHFQEVPFIGAAIRHNGDLKAFVSHGEIEYASGKKMEADVSFTNADKIDGSVTLRTPFSSDLTARINHEGDISACKTSGFLQYSRSKQIDIRTTFKNRANLEGTLMIKSPFTEDISASVNSGKQVGLVDVHIEGKYGLTKKYEGDMKYSNTDKFQSSLELKSPHHDDIIIKVEHSGQMSRFSCHAEGQYGKQKKYEGDLSHSFDGNLLTFASFKSPHYSDISGKIEHTGNYKQFSSHVETQYGNDKYEGDVTFNNAKKFDVAVILKSPGRKHMSVAFSHEGSLKKFRTSSSLNLTPKAKFNIDVLFSNAKKTFGSFTLKSPMLPKIDAQLKHKGDLKNLDSSFEVKVNKQKKLGIDIGFANKKRMVGTLKIVSPVFEDINMKMVHKGRSTNFKLSPSMSVGKNKYSCDFTFKAKPSIKMTLSAVTPHKGFKKIKADLTHSGTLKSFKSQTSFALGKEKYSGNVKFTLRPNLIIDIDAETPLKGLKKVGAAITHQGTWDNFKCHGEITKGKSKELNGDIEFAIKPFSAFLSLQTPFKKLENTEVSIAHTGGLQKFQNKLKVVALRGKTIEMATNVDTVKDINTDVILKTPFKGLELVSGSFSHSGSWMNFHTHAELDNGSPNKYTGDIKLSTDRQINGEVTVRTPVAGYETLSLALSHDGTANNFRLHGEIQCNIDKSEADITFSSMGKIEGELIVKSPYIKTVKASISAKPSPYSGKILATYGKKELVKFISMLNNEKDIKGSASLNTWLSKEFRTTLSHEGSMKKFRTQLELAYGNNKIQTDTSLDASSDVLARTTIRTPFRGYETLSASTSFAGNLRNLRSHADVSVNDKMVETELTLSTENPITGSLAIRTPFSSLREMVGSIKHSGRPLNFKSHAEYSLNGKKAEADIVFDVLGDIKISGSLKHPSIQDLTFQVNHNGQRNDFRSHVELIYRGMKQVNGDISFSISPSIEFSCKLDANCPIIRNIDIAVTHKGPKRNFVSSAAITFNGEKIDGELHLDSRNGVDGRVIMRTPIAEDIIVTMVHKGDARNFRSEGDLVFGNSNQYHAELTLNAMSKLEINSKLNTPDETYSLGLNHEGDLSAFKLSSFLTYGSDKRIQVNTNFDQSDKIFGQLTASAPFLSDVEVEFGHSGKSDNFRTSGFVKYGGNEEIGTDITFGSRSAKKGSLSLRRLGSKVDIVFSHDGSFPNIESAGIISHNGKRIVGLDIKLQNSNGFTGSATLKTASSEWKKTIISVRNIMNSDKISNEVEITYGRNKKIESDVEVTFTSPFKGSFIVKSPFDGFEESRASYIISPSSSGFQGHAEIKIFGQNAAIDTSLSQLKSIDGSMTITTSLPGLKDFRASFSYEGRGNYVLSHAESAYNGEKISSDLKLDARSDINGFLKIITPFDSMKRQTMTIRHSETESYAEIECLNEKISGKLERSNGRMKLSLQSPFQGFEDQELMYNKDGSVTHVEGIFRGEKAELDVTIGNSDISVVAKTPFKGYEEQRVAYRNDGTTRHIEGIYNNKKIEGDLSFSPNLVEVVIRTPFKGFEEQRSTYSFDGTTRHIEVIFRNQKFEGDIVFTPRRVMVLARSPITGFEEQRLLYTSDDSTYHIEGIFQGRKAEADLLVSPERMEIVTKSPFRGYEEQRALYNYDGSAHHVEGIFRGEKVEADLLISRRMMEISIKSPFTGFESQKISYSNDGRTQRIEVTFRGNKANAELTITPDMTEAIVKSPFDGFKEQKLLYRNDGTTKHLEGTFRKQKAEADLTFTSGLIEIIVKTPFRGYTKQRVLYRNDGNKLHLEGLFNGQGAEADVSMGPSDIEISSTNSI